MVPDASGSAGEIIGTDTGDEDKSNTVNVDVADQDGKPVEDAEITVDKDGAISVTLPDDFTFDENGPVTVTVTDNQGEAKPGVSVTVEDGDGTTAAFQEYMGRKLRRETQPSVLERLEQYKDMARNTVEKVRKKVLER